MRKKKNLICCCCDVLNAELVTAKLSTPRQFRKGHLEGMASTLKLLGLGVVVLTLILYGVLLRFQQIQQRSPPRDSNTACNLPSLDPWSPGMKEALLSSFARPRKAVVLGGKPVVEAQVSHRGLGRHPGPQNRPLSTGPTPLPRRTGPTAATRPSFV